MNWVSLAVVGFVLFSSWGCSPLSGLNPAQNNNASSEVGIHNATQVFAGQCIFSPPVAGEPTGVPLALLLPLVEPLIGAAYDLTVAAVRKGGEDTDVTYGGHVNLIGTRDDMPRCIQLVRGSFYTNLNAHDRAGGVKLGRLVGATEDAENAEKVVRERLAKADVLLADEPDLFLEFMRIDSDPSHDALALAVTKAAFLRSAIGGLGTNKRDLVVTAGLKGTDPQTGSDLGSLSPLKIEGISQGYNKNFVDNAFSESGQRPIVRGPRTKWMANPLNANAQAYIVTADVAETRRGNQVFAEIAEALETAQPGVIQAAKQAIDPAAREQARAARREQRKTARDTYDEQLAAAIVAVNACETMTDASLAVRIEKAKNAALAQRSANEAAIEAGERVPFPDPISLASFIDAEEAQDVGC